MKNEQHLGKLLFQRADSPGWYADLRYVEGYPGLSGKKVALKPKGKGKATADRDEAIIILNDLLQQVGAGEPSQEAPQLRDYIPYHLGLKKIQGTKLATLKRSESSLRIFVELMGDLRVSDLTVSLIHDFLKKRGSQPGGRGSIRKGSEKSRPRINALTIRNDLNSLSNLCQRAVSEGHLERNPMRLLVDKPKPRRDREARCLEVEEGARLLDACRILDSVPNHCRVDFLLPLFAAFLLTGGRREEVFGLKVENVDLRNDQISFQPNEWRDLKRQWHRRTIPLWPQLKGILEPHIEEKDLKKNDLLFPAKKGGTLRDLRGSFKRILELAEIDPDGLNMHSFRHTYGAVRLQTLDNGGPVDLYKVARELGHKTLSELQDRYAHLLKRPTKSEGVEYTPFPGTPTVSMTEYLQRFS